MGNEANLFIIGAMKSGTTSLHEYLGSHPRIFMSREKEPGYFVEELALAKGESWYRSLFDADERYLYRGESSTHYTKLPVYGGVVERIYRFNPQARLIYIMRNPFERTVSHYWHAVRDLHHGGELRPLLEAVREQPDYLAFSDYAMQLEPYIERFGRESVYALTFEALVRDPQSEVDRICDWLELERCAIGGETARAHNQKPQSIVGVAGAGVFNRIEHSRVWDRVSPLVPRPLKEWARRRAYRVVDQEQYLEDIPRLKREIAALQERQIEDLARLLNRHFPEWSDERDMPAPHCETEPVTRTS